MEIQGWNIIAFTGQQNAAHNFPEKEGILALIRWEVLLPFKETKTEFK